MSITGHWSPQGPWSWPGGPSSLPALSWHSGLSPAPLALGTQWFNSSIKKMVAQPFEVLLLVMRAYFKVVAVLILMYG